MGHVPMTHGLDPNPALTKTTAKAAEIHLAATLGQELGPRGIRVNVIAPGAVETPLLKASLDDPRFGEATRKFVSPLGRNGSPDEIARVATFLQSEQASFVSGTVVFVDGGMDAMIRPDRY